MATIRIKIHLSPGIMDPSLPPTDEQPKEKNKKVERRQRRRAERQHAFKAVLYDHVTGESYTRPNPDRPKTIWQIGQTNRMKPGIELELCISGLHYAGDPVACLEYLYSFDDCSVALNPNPPVIRLHRAQVPRRARVVRPDPTVFEYETTKRATDMLTLGEPVNGIVRRPVIQHNMTKEFVSACLHDGFLHCLPSQIVGEEEWLRPSLVINPTYRSNGRSFLYHSNGRLVFAIENPSKSLHIDAEGSFRIVADEDDLDRSPMVLVHRDLFERWCKCTQPQYQFLAALTVIDRFRYHSDWSMEEKCRPFRVLHHMLNQDRTVGDVKSAVEKILPMIIPDGSLTIKRAIKMAKQMNDLPDNWSDMSLPLELCREHDRMHGRLY